MSNKHMWRGIRIGGFLLLSVSALAQPSLSAEQGAIERVKQVLASTLDDDLPRVSFEYFLKYEANGAPIVWSIESCSDQSDDSAGNRPKLSKCVQADFAVKNHGGVTVLVSAEDTRVVSVTITDSSGKNRSVPRLSLLPMELHRPPPKVRTPRDLPEAVGD